MAGDGAFETDHWDGIARRGELRVPSGDAIRTPALLPVVNPNHPTVPPSDLPDFGAAACITNAYILYDDPDLRAAARERGVHDLLGFDGPIMTDSGAFQLAEYGSIDASNEEILAFQREIGVDVVTPVDVPTPPDADRETAERDLVTTRDRVERAVATADGAGLVAGPVQGSTHPDLRERAARDVAATGADVHPVGGVVPLLRDYRFDDVVDATMAAKRGLGHDAPVHLFGAGHPMAFGLAAACGCDLFDSAAYALYARDGRYLTVRGTEQLDDLDEFPCACPVCVTNAPDDLQAMDEADRETALARHNLHVSFAELRRVRTAIRAGNLFELVETRARAHPAILDGYRALLDHADQLVETDPASTGTPFLVSPESAARPEVVRYHRRLDRIDVPDSLRLVEVGVAVPADSNATNGDLTEWPVVPPFGPVPPALRRTYPLSAETPERPGFAGHLAAADGVRRLVGVAASRHDGTDSPGGDRERGCEAGSTGDSDPNGDRPATGGNPESDDRNRFVLVHDDWPAEALDRLPSAVACRRGVRAETGSETDPEPRGSA